MCFEITFSSELQQHLDTAKAPWHLSKCANMILFPNIRTQEDKNSPFCRPSPLSKKRVTFNDKEIHLFGGEYDLTRAGKKPYNDRRVRSCVCVCGGGQRQKVKHHRTFIR